jgi:hypothetical protein
MKHRFQLCCIIEPDDASEFNNMDDNAVRRSLAERLAKALEHSTAAESISAASRATVALHAYEENPHTQALRAKAQEQFNDDPCDWHIDDDAAVSVSERAFPSDIYSLAGYVQGWVYTGIIGKPQEPQEEDQ